MSPSRSGGGVWIPGNEVLRKAGVADSPEQVRGPEHAQRDAAGGPGRATREPVQPGRGYPDVLTAGAGIFTLNSHTIRAVP